MEARRRGGELRLDAAGGQEFTPVELLLAGIAGCSGIDVDALTSRLAEPLRFTMTASGEKVRDDDGNHMGPITVTVAVDFPEGADGDRARDRLPDAVARSRDRLCTVSRTVQLSAPVSYELR